MYLIITSYVILLLIPFLMGLISGMQQNIKIEKGFILSAINAFAMGFVVLLGYLLSLLLPHLAEIKYLSGVIILVSGLIMLMKSGKSNLFIMAADTKHYLRYLLANLGIGMNLLIASLGLAIFEVLKSKDILLFTLFSFIVHFIGIKSGKTIEKVRSIKIFILISSVLLILFGLTLIIVDHNKIL